MAILAKAASEAASSFPSKLLIIRIYSFLMSLTTTVGRVWTRVMTSAPAAKEAAPSCQVKVFNLEELLDLIITEALNLGVDWITIK